MGILDFNNDGDVSFAEGAFAAGMIGQYLHDDLEEQKRVDERGQRRERNCGSLWDDDYDNDDDPSDDDYGYDDEFEPYDDEEDSDVAERHFRVAGVKFDDRDRVWMAARASGTEDIELVPEPDNEYDSHAVAVYVDGKHGGYVPADEAKSIFRCMESGGDATVVDHDISVRPDRKDPDHDVVDVWLTVECDVL